MKSFSDQLYWVMILGMLGASVFFTLGIHRAKSQADVSSADLHLVSGQKAVVKKIMDGDEILAEAAGRKFIVRLLGVSSFDPALNDPLEQGAGQAAVFYLQKLILNNEIEIFFDEFKVDSSGRVLAYVHKNSIDVGEDMVTAGLSLTYTKYSFSRMTKYLRAQRTAYEAKRGIWENPRLEQRATELLRTWEQERK